MNRLRRHLQQLGAPGVIGLLLGASALALSAFTLWPTHQRSTELQQRLSRQLAEREAERTHQAETARDPPQNRLAQFYLAFPEQKALPEWLEKIYALAGDQSLTLEQAQYKLVPEASGRLARYEISLPVSGAYPQLRRFIEKSLAEIPALALRDLDLKRDGIDKDTVEAALQFVLYVRSE